MFMSNKTPPALVWGGVLLINYFPTIEVVASIGSSKDEKTTSHLCFLVEYNAQL